MWSVICNTCTNIYKEGTYSTLWAAVMITPGAIKVAPPIKLSGFDLSNNRHEWGHSPAWVLEKSNVVHV